MLYNIKNKKERYIPEGYKEYTPELGDYPKDMFAAYINIEQPHNPKAMFFVGKQANPIWHYRFANIEAIKVKVNAAIANLMAHEDYKAKRKAEKMEARKNMDITGVKIGDIYRWTGGYNCTRNAYIKVMGFTGKNKVQVIELPKTQVDGDWMNGNVAPVVDFVSDNIRTYVLRPAYNGGVRIRDTKGYHEDYYKWNGRPDWENCD